MTNRSETAMDDCASFQDLFRAAKGRDMTDEELRDFSNRSQPAINALVRSWVGETRGRFVCEDTRGGDGVVYTAFSRCRT